MPEDTIVNSHLTKHESLEVVQASQRRKSFVAERTAPDHQRLELRVLRQRMQLRVGNLAAAETDFSHVCRLGQDYQFWRRPAASRYIRAALVSDHFGASVAFATAATPAAIPRSTLARFA